MSEEWNSGLKNFGLFAGYTCQHLQGTWIDGNQSIQMDTIKEPKFHACSLDQLQGFAGSTESQVSLFWFSGIGSFMACKCSTGYPISNQGFRFDPWIICSFLQDLQEIRYECFVHMGMDFGLMERKLVSRETLIEGEQKQSKG